MAHALVGRDLPEFEITIGVEGGRPGPADDFLEEARQGEPALVRRLGLGDANYVVQSRWPTGACSRASCRPEGNSRTLRRSARFSAP